MSQITDITLADSSAVAQTFSAVFKDGLECKWTYNDGSSISQRPNVIMKMRQEDKNKGLARKSSIQVIMPYTETVDSVEVTKYATARVEFITPESASATIVADLLSFTDAALSETLVKDTVKDAIFPL